MPQPLPPIKHTLGRYEGVTVMVHWGLSCGLQQVLFHASLENEQHSWVNIPCIITFLESVISKWRKGKFWRMSWVFAVLKFCDITGVLYTIYSSWQSLSWWCNVFLSRCWIGFVTGGCSDHCTCTGLTSSYFH